MFCLIISFVTCTSIATFFIPTTSIATSMYKPNSSPTLYIIRLKSLQYILNFFLLYVAMSRSFTIENKCQYTIWPATYGYRRSLETTGFVLEKGETRTIKAPSSWIGRFWGRTLCSTNSTGGFSCATGDCTSGKIKCLGIPIDPTTVVEFNLASYGVDYYVVNVFNGYNLPLLVTPENKNCRSIECVIDMNETCPSELMVNSSGLGSHHPIACMTTCQRYQLPELCCIGLSSGVVVPPGICKRTIYSRTFNNVCPSAYSYAYDVDNSSFTCPNFSNFVITFCPSSSTVPEAGNIKTGTEAKGKFFFSLTYGRMYHFIFC